MINATSYWNIEYEGILYYKYDVDDQCKVIISPVENIIYPHTVIIGQEVMIAKWMPSPESLDTEEEWILE